MATFHVFLPSSWNFKGIFCAAIGHTGIRPILATVIDLRQLCRHWQGSQRSKVKFCRVWKMRWEFVHRVTGAGTGLLCSYFMFIKNKFFGNINMLPLF
jgi:hypothetical protein